MTRPPWSREPGEVGSIPTMVSREERRYLHWLGRTQWRDRGHVLEIGPWLGGSTVCLAAGMRAGHSAPRHALHAVDNFRWREFMVRYAPLPLEPGASFEPYFRANVAEFGALVRSHALALPDEVIAADAHAGTTRAKESEHDAPFAWQTADKIEILFIDGAKSWRGMRSLLATVRPALTVGESLLVAQDYKHWGAYWVPLFLAGFHDVLKLEHDVRRGSTVTFRLARELPEKRIQELPDHIGALGVDDARAKLNEAADVLAALGDDLGAAQVRLGEVMLALHRGMPARAIEVYERACSEWPSGADTHALRQAHERLSKDEASRVRPPPRMSRLAKLRRRIFHRA